MSPVSLVLRPRAAVRALRASAMNHAFAGLLLAQAAVGNLDGGLTPLGVLDVAAGLSLFLLCAREVRHLTRHPDAPLYMGWADLLGVGVLLIEAYHKLHAGKVYLPWAYAFV